MSQKVIFGIIILFLLLSIAALSTYTFSQGLKLRQAESDLDHLKKMKERIVNELIDLQEEREGVLSENEKVNADLVGHFSEQERLKTQNRELEEKVEAMKAKMEEHEKTATDLSKELKLLELERETLQAQLEEAEGKNPETVGELKALRETVNNLEYKLKDERAISYYNLGVAYDQSKMTNEALKAYKKSLEINDQNPNVYYNLGILYEEGLSDTSRALEAYENYLKLEPDAEEANDVREWIESIRGQEWRRYG